VNSNVSIDVDCVSFASAWRSPALTHQEALTDASLAPFETMELGSKLKV
jgi:hypothetical protein